MARVASLKFEHPQKSEVKGNHQPYLFAVAAPSPQRTDTSDTGRCDCVSVWPPHAEIALGSLAHSSLNSEPTARTQMRCRGFLGEGAAA